MPTIMHAAVDTKIYTNKLMRGFLSDKVVAPEVNELQYADRPFLPHSVWNPNGRRNVDIFNTPDLQPELHDEDTMLLLAQLTTIRPHDGAELVPWKEKVGAYRLGVNARIRAARQSARRCLDLSSMEQFDAAGIQTAHENQPNFDAAMRYMNKFFGFDLNATSDPIMVKCQGQCATPAGKTPPFIKAFSVAAFCNRHKNVTLVIPARLDEDNDDEADDRAPKTIEVTKVWLSHVLRADYHGAVFAPDFDCPPGTLNTYSALNVISRVEAEAAVTALSEEEDGNFNLDAYVAPIVDHLRDVTAAGNLAIFNYILDTLAWVVQGKGRPKVMIINQVRHQPQQMRIKF